MSAAVVSNPSSCCSDLDVAASPIKKSQGATPSHPQHDDSSLLYRASPPPPPSSSSSSQQPHSTAGTLSSLPRSQDRLLEEEAIHGNHFILEEQTATMVSASMSMSASQHDKSSKHGSKQQTQRRRRSTGKLELSSSSGHGGGELKVTKARRRRSSAGASLITTENETTTMDSLSFQPVFQPFQDDDDDDNYEPLSDANPKARQNDDQVAKESFSCPGEIHHVPPFNSNRTKSVEARTNGTAPTLDSFSDSSLDESNDNDNKRHVATANQRGRTRERHDVVLSSSSPTKDIKSIKNGSVVISIRARSNKRSKSAGNKKKNKKPQQQEQHPKKYSTTAAAVASNSSLADTQKCDKTACKKSGSRNKKSNQAFSSPLSLIPGSLPEQSDEQQEEPNNHLSLLEQTAGDDSFSINDHDDDEEEEEGESQEEIDGDEDEVPYLQLDLSKVPLPRSPEKREGGLSKQFSNLFHKMASLNKVTDVIDEKENSESTLDVCAVMGDSNEHNNADWAWAESSLLFLHVPRATMDSLVIHQVPPPAPQSVQQQSLLLSSPNPTHSRPNNRNWTAKKLQQHQQEQESETSSHPKRLTNSGTKMKQEEVDVLIVPLTVHALNHEKLNHTTLIINQDDDDDGEKGSVALGPDESAVDPSSPSRHGKTKSSRSRRTFHQDAGKEGNNKKELDDDAAHPLSPSSCMKSGRLEERGEDEPFALKQQSPLNKKSKSRRDKLSWADGSLENGFASPRQAHTLSRRNNKHPQIPDVDSEICSPTASATTDLPDDDGSSQNDSPMAESAKIMPEAQSGHVGGEGPAVIAEASPTKRKVPRAKSERLRSDPDVILEQNLATREKERMQETPVPRIRKAQSERLGGDPIVLEKTPEPGHSVPYLQKVKLERVNRAVRKDKSERFKDNLGPEKEDAEAETLKKTKSMMPNDAAIQTRKTLRKAWSERSKDELDIIVQEVSVPPSQPVRSETPRKQWSRTMFQRVMDRSLSRGRRRRSLSRGAESDRSVGSNTSRGRRGFLFRQRSNQDSRVAGRHRSQSLGASDRAFKETESRGGFSKLQRIHQGDRSLSHGRVSSDRQVGNSGADNGGLKRQQSGRQGSVQGGNRPADLFGSSSLDDQTLGDRTVVRKQSSSRRANKVGEGVVGERGRTLKRQSSGKGVAKSSCSTTLDRPAARKKMSGRVLLNKSDGDGLVRQPSNREGELRRQKSRRGGEGVMDQSDPGAFRQQKSGRSSVGDCTFGTKSDCSSLKRQTSGGFVGSAARRRSTSRGRSDRGLQRQPSQQANKDAPRAPSPDPRASVGVVQRNRSSGETAKQLEKQPSASPCQPRESLDCQSQARVEKGREPAPKSKPKADKGDLMMMQKIRQAPDGGTDAAPDSKMIPILIQIGNSDTRITVHPARELSKNNNSYNEKTSPPSFDQLGAAAILVQASWRARRCRSHYQSRQRAVQ